MSLQQILVATGGASAPAWWEVAGETCVGAYAPKGSADLASSYANLANAGTPVAPGVAPTWNSTDGWVFDGATQWLETSLTPTNDQTWTIIVRYSGASVNQAWVMGLSSSGFTSYFGIDPVYFGSIQYAAGATLGVGTSTASGVLAIAGNQPYHDGSAEASTISSGGGSFASLGIGAVRNFDGSATAFYSGNIQALAIYSTTLDATQIANLTTAMNAL